MPEKVNENEQKKEEKEVQFEIQYQSSFVDEDTVPRLDPEDAIEIVKQRENYRVKIFSPKDNTVYDGKIIGRHEILFFSDKNVQNIFLDEVVIGQEGEDAITMRVYPHYYADGYSVLVTPKDYEFDFFEELPTCRDFAEHVRANLPIQVGDKGQFTIDTTELQYSEIQNSQLNFGMHMDHSSVFDEEDLKTLKVFKDGFDKVSTDLYINDDFAGEIRVSQKEDIYNLNYFCKKKQGPITTSEYHELLEKTNSIMAQVSSVFRNKFDKEHDMLNTRDQEIDFIQNKEEENIDELATKSRYEMPKDREYDLASLNEITNDEQSLEYLWFLVFIPVLLMLVFYGYKKYKRKSKIETTVVGLSAFETKDLEVSKMEYDQRPMQLDIPMKF